MKHLPFILLLALLCSCGTLFDTGITITKVMDAAAKDYAQEYKKGTIPPEVHAKVQKAWAAYYQASQRAADALELSKVNGTADTAAILRTVRLEADLFLDAISPYIATAILKSDLAKTSKL